LRWFMNQLLICFWFNPVISASPAFSFSWSSIRSSEQ
jgi:hypothetical protein